MGFMMIGFFWGFAGGGFFVLFLSAVIAHVLSNLLNGKFLAIGIYLASTALVFYLASFAVKGWGFWMSSEWPFQDKFIASLVVFATMYAFYMTIVMTRKAKW